MEYLGKITARVFDGGKPELKTARDFRLDDLNFRTRQIGGRPCGHGNFGRQTHTFDSIPCYRTALPLPRRFTLERCRNFLKSRL